VVGINLLRDKGLDMPEVSLFLFFFFYGYSGCGNKKLPAFSERSLMQTIGPPAARKLNVRRIPLCRPDEPGRMGALRFGENQNGGGEKQIAFTLRHKLSHYRYH